MAQRQGSEAFVAAYHVKARPFQWTETSDAISAKARAAYVKLLTGQHTSDFIAHKMGSN